MPVVFTPEGPKNVDPKFQEKIEDIIRRGDTSKMDEIRFRHLQNQEELDRFRHQRQQRPGNILGRIVRAGGLEAQERAQLSAMANRQLGLEAERLQQGYQRSLAEGGGRQVGSRLLPYGNRLLIAQQQVQDNLNKLAMERKQRALEMQLQLKRERQGRNFENARQRQALYGSLLKNAIKIGANFIPGIGPVVSAGLTAADAASSPTPASVPQGYGVNFSPMPVTDQDMTDDSSELFTTYQGYRT